MKYALVTGANKGIGYEIARQLGKKGFFVFLGARDHERGTIALKHYTKEGLEGAFVQIDVANEASVAAAIQEMTSRTGHLDVLINNAGILPNGSTPLTETPPIDAVDTLHTNALGTLWVTQACLPLLNPGSRVILVSSGGGAILNGVSGFAPMYSVSKTTMNAIGMHLSRELSAQHIPVNVVDPGWVRTDMGGNSAGRSVEQGADTPVWLATEADPELTGKFWYDRKERSW